MTFDTYGTLIDWEAGILAAFGPALRAREVEAVDDDLLERYARHEAATRSRHLPSVRRGSRPGVRRHLRGVGFPARRPGGRRVLGIGRRLAGLRGLGGGPARLKRRFRLGVITNCDDGLFALSNARLGVEFDWIVTAEQAGSYKPSRRNFELALATIDVPTRTDPSRRAEPLPRPRDGQGARPDHRLGRSPARAGELRRDAAGGGRARPGRPRHANACRVGRPVAAPGRRNAPQWTDPRRPARGTWPYRSVHHPDLTPQASRAPAGVSVDRDGDAAAISGQRAPRPTCQPARVERPAPAAGPGGARGGRPPMASRRPPGFQPVPAIEIPTPTNTPRAGPFPRASAPSRPARPAAPVRGEHSGPGHRAAAGAWPARRVISVTGLWWPGRSAGSLRRVAATTSA